MKISRYVALVTDYDENGQCDGRPRAIGTFTDEADAYEFILEDMRGYINMHTDDNGQCAYVMDDEDFEIHDDTFQNGCKYVIMPFEAELTDAEKRKAADELIGDMPF